MNDMSRLMDIRSVLGGAMDRIFQAADANAGTQDAARLNEIATSIRAYAWEVADRLERMEEDDNVSEFRTKNAWKIKAVDDAHTALSFFRDGRPMQRDDLLKALVLLVLHLNEREDDE